MQIPERSHRHLSILDIELSKYKWVCHHDRLRALAEGGAAMPITLELDITNRCNHHCQWCVDPAGCHGSTDMDRATAQRTLEQARSLGCCGVVLKGGGECTLHPELAEIIRHAAGIGLECGVVTNGSLLGSEQLCSALVEAAAYVRISIDGPNPETRQLIHGVNDFSRLCAGTRLLLAERGRQRHPIVGATFCLEYSHRGLVQECIDLGADLGLDYVLMRPPFCEEVGFAAPHLPQQAAELRRLIREAATAYQGAMTVLAGSWIGDREMAAPERCATPVNGAVDLSRRDSGIRHDRANGIEHVTRRCPAAGLLCVVTADGEVYGCCCLRKLPAYCLGRIGEQTPTLQEVLESATANAVLERMRRTECLEHCTHPYRQLNEVIDYLQSQQYHSSFI